MDLRKFAARTNRMWKFASFFPRRRFFRFISVFSQPTTTITYATEPSILPPYLARFQLKFLFFLTLHFNRSNSHPSQIKLWKSTKMTINVRTIWFVVVLLIGVYASERAGSPVGPCHSSSEGQARSSDNATGAAALRSSSTPSGQQQQQQPPTPPHTPKTSNATSGQPTGLSLGLYRSMWSLSLKLKHPTQFRNVLFCCFFLWYIGRSVDYSCGVSDPSLMALQSHMHSLLTNSRQSSSLNQLRNSAGSPSGGADLESASDAPSEVQHRQQGQLTNTAGMFPYSFVALLSNRFTWKGWLVFAIV